MLVELPFAVGLVAWAWWLGGKYGAPRCVRWVGLGCAGVWLTLAVYSVFGLIESFGSVSAESTDPAQKARVLAENISQSMWSAMLGMGVLAVGLVAMLVLTWRYHWSAKPPVAPGSPPYR
jgi:hypothetical protein